MPYSLLDEPLFRIRLPDGTHAGATLPEVLAHLATDDIASFEALQPHQQQPWYSLLVQLGALTRARTAHEDLPDTPREWHTALRTLAGGDAQAWQLITDDPAQPAFMQPPILENSLEEANYKDDIPTPDQLDVLITSKSHDVKSTRITAPQPEHWIYALVTLQTMEGFLGRGNYGIVRMNGGFGNRPLVGLTPDLAWGPRFRRDVQVLGDARQDLLDRYDAHGPMLLWTEPWGGAKDEAIYLYDCDPYFVEICRRIRFTVDDDGSLRCWRANTKGQRLDAPDSLNGMTGDPWTPIDKGEGKALTLGEAGFTYQKLHDILLGEDYERPPALEFQSGETDAMYLVARTLVRGQGKTDGLHHRIVPVPSKATTFLTDDTARDQLAKRAKMRIEKAASVRSKVLYPALSAVLTGRPDERPDSDQLAPWMDAFDRAIDARFFERLWASVEMDQQDAQADWQQLLRDEAESQFDDAKDHAPQSATRYWRAHSSAESIFRGALRNHLPEAFPEKDTAEQASVRKAKA